MHRFQYFAGRSVGRKVILGVLLLLAGCASWPFGKRASSSALQNAVRLWAEGFDAKRPVVADAGLGKRVFRGIPEDNPCFGGEEGVKRLSGAQKSMNVHYDATASADLVGDWGQAVKVNGGGVVTSEVQLDEIEVLSLDGLYMEPSSGCGTASEDVEKYSSKDGQIDWVITQAAHAKSLQVQWGNGAHLDFNLPPVTITSSGTLRGGWKAEAVYFAHALRKFRVMLRELKPIEVALKSPSPALERCDLVVDGIDDKRWSGQLNCPGDKGKGASLEGNLNAWHGVRTGYGVTYMAKVGPSRFGFATVELRRWYVKNVD